MQNGTDHIKTCYYLSVKSIYNFWLLVKKAILSVKNNKKARKYIYIYGMVLQRVYSLYMVPFNSVYWNF